LAGLPVVRAFFVRLLEQIRHTIAFLRDSRLPRSPVRFSPDSPDDGKP
jgi:hypothetical protein